MELRQEAAATRALYLSGKRHCADSGADAQTKRKPAAERKLKINPPPFVSR